MNPRIKRIVEELAKKGFFVTPDFIQELHEDFDINEFIKKLKLTYGDSIPRILTKEVLLKIENKEKQEVIRKERKVSIKTNGKSITLTQFFKEVKEDKKIRIEKTVKIEQKIILKEEKKVKEVEIIEPKKRYIGEEIETNVKIEKNFVNPPEEISVPAWAQYFKIRLQKLKKALKLHKELENVVSIDLANKKENEEVSVVGLVYEKRILPNGNLKLILEDLTGTITIYVKKDSEIYSLAKSIPEDSVVGVFGTAKNGIIFPEQIFLPDIPQKSKKTIPEKEDIYVIFTGDFQFGNKLFLKKEFEKFIKWLKGEYGNEKQREIARKVAYWIIPGDIVDGIGVYPNQREELEITDIYKQYEVFEKYLEEVPEYIKIIVIPGNHDVVVRLAEPQPPIPKEYLPNAYQMNNVYFLSNPSYVRIHYTKDFQGFLTLIYHGYSMDWLVSNVELIRQNGGYENAAFIMKFMLQLRHLAPAHGSTAYIPYPSEDPLLIDPIPDIFVTGHIHRTAYGNYRGVDLINASCWQDLTIFQKEMGHIPDPAKVVIKNLRTGEVKILSFKN